MEPLGVGYVVADEQKDELRNAINNMTICFICIVNRLEMIGYYLCKDKFFDICDQKKWRDFVRILINL